MMIKFTLLFVLSLFNFKSEERKLQVSKWVITQNSSLVVNGSTNINKFSCMVLKYASNDTVSISKENNKLTLTGVIHIEVKNFNCNNMMMTKDLRKTLKAGAFPLLRIRLLSLQETGTSTTPKLSAAKGDVEIEIAGKTKHFNVTYLLEKTKNCITLTGNQAINFSDFNLQPPKKMGQLIRAKNELNVVLTVKMELI